MSKQRMLESHELRAMGVTCGDNCKVDKTVALITPEKLWLGDNVRIDYNTIISGHVFIERNSHISVGCMLMAGREMIRLGVNNNMSAYSRIYAESDDLAGRGMIGPCVHESTRHVHRAPVVMHDYCCLGPDAIMMPGSRLRWGSNLMAYSILLGDTEQEGIYQGVPAKRIKDRLPNWKAHLQLGALRKESYPSEELLCGELYGHD